MGKDFKAFIARGNVIDLAVAFILGVAFAAIVQSFVNDILMPPIGLLFGNVDFTNLYVTLQEGTPAGPYASLADAQAAGAVTMNYGVFINTIVSFLIVAFALFLLIRWVVRFQRPPEVTVTPAATESKDCPYCFTPIHVAATRCSACTADLAGANASGAAGV